MENGRATRRSASPRVRSRGRWPSRTMAIGARVVGVSHHTQPVPTPGMRWPDRNASTTYGGEYVCADRNLT